MSNDLKPPEPSDEQGDASDVDALGFLRRSPHPYHRRQAELRSLNQSSEPSSNDFIQPSALTSSKSGSDRDRTISNDDDGRTRRKSSRTPSDSGTEADDEGYSFVRALPAPPIRPRKGLRDFDGGVSPLLTPSQVDEERRKLMAEYFKSSKEGFDGPSPTDEEARTARRKYMKRRRAELIRRTTETGLLVVTGLMVINGCSSWGEMLQWHRVELLSHIIVICALVLLYPLRLLNYSRKNSTTPNRKLRQRIRVPAVFDPAPIIYPISIPVLVSLSLLPTFERILLPNVILSLAALPSQLIPYAGCGNGFCTGHWIISIMPLIASQNTEWPSKLFPPKPYMLKTPPPEGLDPEILASLFALHQTLLPPLRYLTTTSLLPAELHLLSISLINILLFAESPQMVILATLVWFGGLGLFILCGHVLKWGVALARIPMWRFRRAGQIVKARQSFLQILNDGLKKRKLLGIGRRRDISESDADDDSVLINNHIKRKGSLRLDILGSARRTFLAANEAETRSAVEQSRMDPFPKYEEGNDIKPSTRKRRNTVPNLGETHALSRHMSTRHKRSKSSIAQSFLSLTPTQAAIRKWLYAGYVYLVMSTLILGPIRYYIGKYALHGSEPFGWAVGYLFGNIQPMRFWVVNWDLEQWITLPPMHDPADISSAGYVGRAEYLRHYIIGEANTRLLLCGYCVAILGIGMAVVLRLSEFVEVDTRRKVFHGMMVAMLLPTIYVDPAFVALALVLVLSIFLLLDLLRASQLPPLSKPLAYFLTPYIDGRDLKGPVVISHIFLLIGCATPLWLTLAGIERIGARPWEGWEVASRDVSMVAGVVCVGMGDAAASLIGRRYGRHKWPWAGGKSLEGSVAFAIAVTLGLAFGRAWLSFGQWDDNGSWALTLAKAAVSACGASLNEAVLTGGNDNVIVPVVLWLLVRGVRL